MLDVLAKLPEIQVCVAYELDGQRIDYFPAHVNDLRKLNPIYETIPGWQSDVTGARCLDDLPVAAIQYVMKIESLVGRPVEFISVGPDRAQTIHVAEGQTLASYLAARV